MYYIEVKDNKIVGKAFNSYTEEMVETTEEIYNMVESIPSKIKMNDSGEIIDVIPLEKSPKPELPKQPTPEELKTQELESQIEGLQSAMAELTMMMMP